MLKLFYECAYRYNKTGNLKKYLKISSKCSFADFYNFMQNLKNVSIRSAIPNDTAHNLIIRKIKRILKHDEIGRWTFIDFSVIQNEEKEDDSSLKIYLSIDNKNLHFFAITFLKLCEEIGIKYNFKINADDRYRRADNVVIYTNIAVFFQYIYVIESIKKQNP